MKGIILVIGLNLVALLGIFFFFKNRIDKTLRSQEIVRTLQEEIEQLMVELNQTTTRNIEIIEDRINTLKDLIGEADKRIRLVSREAGIQEKSQETYSHLKASTSARARQENPGNALSIQEQDIPVREKVLTMISRGQDAESIARELHITMAEIELIRSLNGKRS